MFAQPLISVIIPNSPPFPFGVCSIENSSWAVIRLLKNNIAISSVVAIKNLAAVMAFLPKWVVWGSLKKAFKLERLPSKSLLFFLRCSFKKTASFTPFNLGLFLYFI